METIMTLIILIVIITIAHQIDQINKKKKKERMNLASRNASICLTLQHFCGLSIPENSMVQIFSCPTTYEFDSNGNTFKIDKNRVTDINITSHFDTQSTYVSSVGGAIGGGLLFGPIGAALGGRVKEKTKQTITNYLVFTYSVENDVKYVAFNANFLNSKLDLIQEFKANSSNKTNEVIL